MGSGIWRRGWSAGGEGTTTFPEFVDLFTPAPLSLMLKSLVADRYLLGGERGDVAIVVRGFHNYGVASVGERSCIQRILKANIGRRSRESDWNI